MSSELATTPSGRRRAGRTHNAEDETLSQIAKEAEAKLAQKRAARIEAREIRMRELERQQREADEKPGKDREDKSSKTIASTSWTGSYGGLSSSVSVLSSRSSDETHSGPEPTLRELKDGMEEMEEKYRQSMVQNAQLDNERTQLHYRVEQLKDMMEDQEEQLYRVQKYYREKCQEVERGKRVRESLAKKVEDLQEALRQRDELIQEQGLVLIGGNQAIDDESGDEDAMDGKKEYARAMSEAAGDGSLNVQLKHLKEEKEDLFDEVQRLRMELDEIHRNGELKMSKNSSSMITDNGAVDMQFLELQREANRQIGECKFKLQKAEQEILDYQSNVSRLEGQLQRYKATIEVLEKSEEETRAEKRKLQRDLRASLDCIEELQMTNAHLEKRLDRLRATRAQNSQI